KDVARCLQKMSISKNINSYPPNLIPSLREIVSRVIFKRSCSKDFDLICTEGAQSALAYCMLTFVNRGDEVIITDPGYFFFEPPILTAGGKIKRITLSKKNNFRIDIESLKKKITPRTKIIIICDPINPFGTIQTEDELREIIKIANKYNIIVLNNITHSFHRLNVNAEHSPMSSLRGANSKNVITIAGLSHGYGLAGLRIGFLGAHPEILKSVLSIKSALTRINTNLLTQYAAIAALKDKEYIHNCGNLLRKNFSFLKDIIYGIPALSFIIEPDYGFFACVDTSKIKASSQELTVALLKRHCAVYPSDGLGNTKASSYIRINFSTPHRKHFTWLKKALPEAIKEAETRKYGKAVIDFFKSVGTKRALKIIKDIESGESLKNKN
ncbi:MAG: pyridoxal phosphate-dependent aminotransferase, partial [Candidatus Omnitrophica bacterium]|nr:pyridoxal phosphate-dependent aminotransferase [Candidatus Omnitrophota bacterium]